MSLEEQINSLKNEFYSNNQKKIIFKNKQKLDYAKVVSDSINLETLITNTFITNENTDIILFQYPIFKNYATYDNIKEIIKYFINLVTHKINCFNQYRLYVNLDSYSVTAHERFKNMYVLLFEIDNENHVIFNDKLHSLIVFNSPHILSTLNSFFSSFVDTSVVKKVTLTSKKQTGDKLEKLLIYLNNINI
tara:strand:- start:7750 stop:8322 length:573 start_codon:yes stop_codon:yes gene_type:complete